MGRYYGCPAFKGQPYDDAVTTAVTDAHSADYINSVIGAGDTFGFYASTGVEQVNLADNNTPLLTVQPKTKSHSFPVPYPWASSFYIEPLGDHHAMVVQTQTCRLYEAYDTSYTNGMLSAYSGANWRMKKKFEPLPPGNPSAMASGLSLFAGMVRWEDYESGSILTPSTGTESHTPCRSTISSTRRATPTTCRSTEAVRTKCLTAHACG